MKFWNFSTRALAVLLATVSISNASGPANGQAEADPNSAVVKLSAKEYETFIKENPLVLTEFFAPWCGYCKQLGPEYSKAADTLNETHPSIKLAQVDCTVDEDICSQENIRGYPTLKIIRGTETESEIYVGPRDAEGIANYMIQQSLPPVSEPGTEAELQEIITKEKKPYVVQVSPTETTNATYQSVASKLRNDFTFINVAAKDLIKSLDSKFTNVKLNKNKYLVVHPSDLSDVRELNGDADEEALLSFVRDQLIPYFDDIGRHNFMAYMESKLPLAYYFYDTPEQREAVVKEFNKLGKKYKGKINLVGLDANIFGRHAESLNMDPEIVPLFAIQEMESNKKFGVDQSKYPKGPSTKVIDSFLKDYLAGKVSPIIKSEPLPSDEEKQESAVVKLVAHNHDDILKDMDKDIFVKYYAHWCGFCKKLAPTWEELAEVYDSNKPDAKILIANIDATKNDVETSEVIDAFPKLIFYPANGEVDEKGIRKGIVYESGERQLDSFIDFLNANAKNSVDGHKLKEKRAEVDSEEVKKEDDKVDSVQEDTHDEL